MKNGAHSSRVLLAKLQIHFQIQKFLRNVLYAIVGCSRGDMICVTLEKKFILKNSVVKDFWTWGKAVRQNRIGPNMNLPEKLKLIHDQALLLTLTYKKSEGDLLDIIIQVRDNKVYRYFECTSLFEYCVKILKLDPGVVYGFTAVAKKIEDVPELKEKIIAGVLNVSTAKRITSVITPENKTQWLEKAETLTMRKLEKEVARANPKEEVKERASYLTSKRVRLELGLDEKLMLNIRRIQDLESQRQRRSVNLEDVISVLTEMYLMKNDPMEKAKRAKVRGSLLLESPSHELTPIEPTQSDKKSSTWRKDGVLSRRTALPAKVIHEVRLRDEGQCQYEYSQTNKKCEHKRFIEIHHKTPVYLGGSHDLNNLITLCSEHHKIVHEQLAARSAKLAEIE